jgi:hypothetical protein
MLQPLAVRPSAGLLLADGSGPVQPAQRLLPLIGPQPAAGVVVAEGQLAAVGRGPLRVVAEQGFAQLERAPEGPRGLRTVGLGRPEVLVGEGEQVPVDAVAGLFGHQLAGQLHPLAHLRGRLEGAPLRAEDLPDAEVRPGQLLAGPRVVAQLRDEVAELLQRPLLELLAKGQHVLGLQLLAPADLEERLLDGREDALEVLLGAVALPPGLRRPLDGLRPAPLGQQPEPGDRAEAAHQRQQQQGQQPRHLGVAPAPAVDPLDPPDRPGLDRHPVEEALQVAGQGLGAGVALVPLLLQALQADGLQVARQVRVQPRRRHRLLGQHLHQGVELRVGAEGGPAGEQLVQDRPQSPHVGRGAGLSPPAGGLLGGHVARRPQDDPGLRPAAVPLRPHRVGPQALGQAEVEDLGRAVGGDQDVGGLQVAVDHRVPVGVLDRRADRQQQPGAVPGGQLPVGAVLADRLALDVLHDEVGQAVLGRAAVEQPGDVRVAQTGPGAVPRSTPARPFGAEGAGLEPRRGGMR